MDATSDILGETCFMSEQRNESIFIVLVDLGDRRTLKYRRFRIFFSSFLGLLEKNFSQSLMEKPLELGVQLAVVL